MIKNYDQIKSAFDKYDKSQIVIRPTLVRDTEKCIWGPSSITNVFELFKKIKLKKYKNFLDIGCGDGRVVLVASLFTNANGIEFDKELVDTGNTIAKKIKLKVNLMQDDFFNHDFSEYDIIFTNPDTGFYNGIEDKLFKELNGTLIVYNQVFLPRFLN